MKKERLFIWFLAIIIASVLLIFLKPQETINNIIQAIAIITLVFVTWVYARQTQNLVEQEKKSLKEQKKKNDIDFYEKRINEFYKPFIKYLNDFKEEIHKTKYDINKITELRKNFIYFYWKKRYMTTKETVEKIKKLDVAMAQIEMYMRRESFQEYYDIEKEVKDIINSEWDDLEERIRRYYEY